MMKLPYLICFFCGNRTFDLQKVRRENGKYEHYVVCARCGETARKANRGDIAFFKTHEEYRVYPD